ncbi:MAG: hypothetical protein K6L73_05395 [Cellvibrionaceae bacterium]
MTDKSWLLNPAAIGAARKCIVIIEEELGIRLKLSHPQFLEMIKDYTILNESENLERAYLELAAFAHEGDKKNNKKPKGLLKKAHNIVDIKNPEPASTKKQDSVAGDTVEYQGQKFPRFNDEGKQFQGLYRGQPRYA